MPLVFLYIREICLSPNDAFCRYKLEVSFLEIYNDQLRRVPPLPSAAAAAAAAVMAS
jgi:hypothetical protein